MTQFEELPEECLSTILSRTTPVDVGRLSLVSNTFRSAADSDAVWNQFLPSDSQFMDSIISNSPSLANFHSKKALYLALSDHPIIIDNGLKSFQLDRKSGKICYMLAARSLSISWGDEERYWKWITMPNSRFPEIAKLCFVWWFEIRGIINTLALSPNTQYAAYLVFKMIDAYGFENETVDLTVGVKGADSNTKIVCLDPNIEPGPLIDRWYNERRPRPHNIVGLQCPSVRSDGWLEIKMGEFFNSNLEDEIEMSVMEIKGNGYKGNFFLEGIEVRHKEDN
ncbi:putative F-box protein PP2-B12 [Vicia villosa]|uniref:putative F-box protein PP2-B12 n=1 Tax=Vicia villosa TaxID=3911 RepID=UPI00273ABE39|nr:putative F-box protein PP2-B12 [Vicia villosa]